MNDQPDPLPYIGFGYDDDQVLCAVVGPAEYRSLEELFAAAPYFRATGNEVLLAGALNHFRGHEMGYKVIDDPAGYREDFLRRYAAEEELEWDQFNVRITDFDLPDLERLAVPTVIEGQLVFFANNRSSDTPYRVEGPADGSGKLTYTPL